MAELGFGGFQTWGALHGAGQEGGPLEPGSAQDHGLRGLQRPPLGAGQGDPVSDPVGLPGGRGDDVASYGWGVT